MPIQTRVWLSNVDLAERYDVSTSTVRAWRQSGTGPPGRHFGKHVRYALSDVEAWEDSRADDRSPAA